MERELRALSVLTHTSLRRLGAIDTHRVNPGHAEHQAVGRNMVWMWLEKWDRADGIHCHLLLNSAEHPLGTGLRWAPGTLLGAAQK